MPPTQIKITENPPPFPIFLTRDVSNTLNIVAAAIDLGIDNYRFTENAAYFSFQKAHDDGRIGFLFHSNVCDALRFGNLGWMILREIPKSKTEITISHVPYPRSTISVHEKNDYHPGIFGEVDWFIDLSDWKTGQLSYSIDWSNRFYHPGIDEYEIYGSRIREHTTLIEEIVNQLEQDGIHLFAPPNEGEITERKIQPGTQVKFRNLLAERREAINQRGQPPTKSVACHLVTIDPKTVKTHFPELWKRWDDKKYDLTLA